MKKKTLVSLVAAASIAASCIFVPSVQTFAISALSIFRVGDAKTIKITLADIEEMANYAKQHEDDLKEYCENDENVQNLKGEKPQYKTITDVSQFDAFSFNLPKDLKDETPSIKYVDSISKSFTLDTDSINEKLTDMGYATLLDDKFNGAKITVSAPPSIVASYDDVDLFATQGMYVDGEDSVLRGLWDNILDMSFIPQNIKSQIASIDIKDRDVYLPVIMGLGRETSIGNTTGYIYSTKDMDEISSMLPEDLTKGYESENKKDGSALIWTKNGVLYCLVGDKSDNELSNIARSIP